MYREWHLHGQELALILGDFNCQPGGDPTLTRFIAHDNFLDIALLGGWRQAPAVPTCFANGAHIGQRRGAILAHPDFATLIADIYVHDTGGKYKVHRPLNPLMKATNAAYNETIVKRICIIQHLLLEDVTLADWHGEVDPSSLSNNESGPGPIR